MSSDETQRFELKDGAFKLVDSLPNQNMGYKKTLSDFIVWGSRNYPAKKTALILWNHGAGPVHGYGYDELFEGDALYLNELESALETAKTTMGKKLDLIGFDACLMATVEVADAVSDYAHYLVASEELEPGHGWDYNGIVNALVNKPEMTGEELGFTIIDTYGAHSAENNTTSDITLSLIDLAEIEHVVSTLENLVRDANPRLNEDMFFYEFSRSALTAKSFGGNTASQGYTDIIDLNNFAAYLSTNQFELAKSLSDAIEKAVLYRIEGDYTFDTSGLAIYFPYRDQVNYERNMELYKNTNFSTIYKDFLNDFKKIQTRHEEEGFIEYELLLPNELTDFYQLVLGESSMNKVFYTYIDLYEESNDPEDGYLYKYYGSDFLVRYDAETDSYFDDFNYNWTYYDSEPLMSTVISENDEFVLYESPVLYNDELVNLLFVWKFDFETEFVEVVENGQTVQKEVNVGDSIGGHYETIGLRRGIDPETGIPDKNLYQLYTQDILTPVYKVILEDGSEDLIAGNPIELNEESGLYFGELDGMSYQLTFRLVDFAYNTYFTDFFQVNK